MEKFTVDLDRVLDEFEFNEEQAVRHALQHFKREDLPATKYQKPHFKPINIADADFRPCIETTMSYSTYQHDFSNDSIHKLAETDSVSLSNNYTSKSVKIEHPTVENKNDFIIMNNQDNETINSNYCNNSNEERLLVINADNIIINDLVPNNSILEATEKVQSFPSYYLNKLTLNNDEVKKEVEVKNNVEKNEEVEEEISIGEETENSIGAGEEPESEFQSFYESQNNVSNDHEKSEPTLSNLNEVGAGEVDVNKLPDLINISQTHLNEVDARTSQVQCMNIVSGLEKLMKEKNEKEEEYKDKEEKEEEENKREEIMEKVENKEEKEKEEDIITDVIPQPIKINESLNSVDEIKVTENQNAQLNCQTASQSSESDTGESQGVDIMNEGENIKIESDEIDNSTIKPIQFETQADITDEELQKYLEELEEEEKAEENELEAETVKPCRPQTLDLKESVTEKLVSPKQLNLPRTEDDGADLEGKNSMINNLEVSNVETLGKVEEPAGNLGDNMDETEELERLLEDSISSPSEEPPLTIEERRLGKVSPFWIPDHLASSCMECDSKFTVIKRRHHCRACGRILCSKCCGMRASLEYLQNREQRVCETCFRTLAKVLMYELQNEVDADLSPRRRPNPNNPMEYCSTVPPPLQISSSGNMSPPAVMVPVGVLKREGSSKVKENPKQVMFSDGIRPGGDLTELDGSEESRNAFRKPSRSSKKAGTLSGNSSPLVLLPPIDPVSQSFIVEKSMPPLYIVNKGETTYEENWPLSRIMEKLKDPNHPPLQFAINRNLVACVKIVKLDCCMKESCWVISSKGMGNVGQDEIIILLTLDGENDEELPKEILLQFQYIYLEAAKGNTVNELGYWCVKEPTFLGSKFHGGFLFIRPTFQCLNHIELPPPPYLVGILIHRSEIPWLRVFPFRLMLRLGAEFRYYPCPLVSVRFREPVYYEIGHTIINLLADFRNLSYTIPNVRGLKILMEANQTSILIPRNRYDQVVRALNNSNDPVLALAGSFSPEADAHLVCMQSKGSEVTYSTHAININDKPRKVTGASFVVLNGALKTTSGVTAKSSIVEDGLMVQVPSETMSVLRNKLRNMEDWSVSCGPIEGRNTEEVVKIIWCEDDKNFNIGVKSVIDNMPLDGVPSIRVHSGKDYMGGTKFIRWTQVFIIKCEDGATSAKIGDPLEVNKLSESLARSTCIALIKLLELLAASGLTVLAVRATMDKENVGYEAGGNGEKLAPIYMNSLDNELIPVLHKAASLNDSIAVLELMFHIMDK